VPTFIGQVSWPRPLIGMATFALVLGLLYWLAPVLVPIALAVLLTFLLSPLVRRLERRGINRALAVAAVGLVALALFAGVAWVVGRQATALADAVPQYEDNLAHKLSVLRENSAGLLDRMRLFARTINNQIAAPEGTAPGAAAGGAAAENGAARSGAAQGNAAQSGGGAAPARGGTRQPAIVVVQQEERHLTFSDIIGSLTLAIAPLARATLVIMMVIFMLIWREDLRDRLIALVGHGRITLTTKALDEAGQRIASYLLTQLTINAAFGAALGVGLALIGIPYAVLWGIIAALLRYAPYVGAALGALFPICFSVLTMEGWQAPLLAFVWFLIIETSANFLIEPWIYGRRIGISPTAALVMVAFWTWLWGPVGLILAYPLTVCLVVLGQFVPYLKFLDVLLGDRPVLDVSSRFFQRLLAHDVHEALHVAQEYRNEHSLAETCDRLLLPALVSAGVALRDDALSEQEHGQLLRDCRQIAEEIARGTADGGEEAADGRSAETAASSREDAACVMAFAARDEADELATDMLRAILRPSRHCLRTFGPEVLAAEALASIGEEKPALVFILSVGPGGVTATAVLCRRLRKRFPQQRVVVGRWGLAEDADAVRQALVADGATQVVSSIAELQSNAIAVRDAASDDTRHALGAPAEADGAVAAH